MDAFDRYREFHGKEPRTVQKIRAFPSKRLVVLGRAVAVEYRCSKRNGGGDGRSAVYRHEFETPVDLCMDESGKRFLYLIGDHLIVDDEGIKH
jgi:hypothetical protein